MLVFYSTLLCVQGVYHCIRSFINESEYCSEIDMVPGIGGKTFVVQVRAKYLVEEGRGGGAGQAVLSECFLTHPCLEITHGFQLNIVLAFCWSVNLGLTKFVTLLTFVFNNCEIGWGGKRRMVSSVVKIHLSASIREYF